MAQVFREHPSALIMKRQRCNIRQMMTGTYVNLETLFNFTRMNTLLSLRGLCLNMFKIRDELLWNIKIIKWEHLFSFGWPSIKRQLCYTEAWHCWFVDALVIDYLSCAKVFVICETERDIIQFQKHIFFIVFELVLALHYIFKKSNASFMEWMWSII